MFFGDNISEALPGAWAGRTLSQSLQVGTKSAARFGRCLCQPFQMHDSTPREWDGWRFIPPMQFSFPRPFHLKNP